jgi:Zn-dependent protease with chaperone function
MNKAEQGGQPKFLSTHPSPKDRSKNIEKLLPRVLPFYNARK